MKRCLLILLLCVSAAALASEPVSAPAVVIRLAEGEGRGTVLVPPSGDFAVRVVKTEVSPLLIPFRI